MGTFKYVCVGQREKYSEERDTDKGTPAEVGEWFSSHLTSVRLNFARPSFPGWVKGKERREGLNME